MKARYLTFFSYIGTKFRSSEKIWLKEGHNYPDPQSVQGLMEISLGKLKPLNYPNIFLSSRTDGGVHALNSSAHFDLERHGEAIYDTQFIINQMNKFFSKNQISISVKKCLQVNDNFHARFTATSRTYLYRLITNQLAGAFLALHVLQSKVEIPPTPNTKTSCKDRKLLNQNGCQNLELLLIECSQ